MLGYVNSNMLVILLYVGYFEISQLYLIRFSSGFQYDNQHLGSCRVIFLKNDMILNILSSTFLYAFAAMEIVGENGNLPS